MIKINSLEEFQGCCNKGTCLRLALKSKNCLKAYKQERCYKKYTIKFEKELNKSFDEDGRWVDVVEKVVERDKTCRIFYLLTEQEKFYILNHYIDDWHLLSRILDPAHIIPKGQNPSLKYDENNIILVCRYFHSLLDNLKHPVYKTSITSEERLLWMKSGLERKRLF